MEFEALKQKLNILNEKLKNEYEFFKNNKIDEILDKVSRRFVFKRLSADEISNIATDGIIGVDGSINNYGGIYPHYISIVQALAKSTLNESKLIQDVYAPLFEEEDGQLQDEQRRRARMSKLELDAAMHAIENFKSNIILMDGSLMHYGIDCPLEWQKLKDAALRNNKIIIGVTEEVKTKDIGNIIKEEIKYSNVVYDREVLFGILQEGEALELNEKVKTEKKQKGIRTIFARLSSDPQVIGLDFLEEQFDEGFKLCNLLYTLTPREGRGIPLWLDLVDREVKVTDEMVKTLIESTIDRGIRERIFNPKRSKR
ncbi:NurA domain protein [Caloramator mitchellensis]|uniref:NurA domain protein n=1 Tax=Caloramator mitchellensis TaxID=908809 RepID=A0A0R3K210_CALMK|nr:DNA double-strand break repair nuclease NurA [Caloramator mitchellensis]KRQ86335.1 NurA domain protein [Caloramator mitchellensis]